MSTQEWKKNFIPPPSPRLRKKKREPGDHSDRCSAWFEVGSRKHTVAALLTCGGGTPRTASAIQLRNGIAPIRTAVLAELGKKFTMKGDPKQETAMGGLWIVSRANMVQTFKWPSRERQDTTPVTGSVTAGRSQVLQLTPRPASQHRSGLEIPQQQPLNTHHPRRWRPQTAEGVGPLLLAY